MAALPLPSLRSVVHATSGVGTHSDESHILTAVFDLFEGFRGREGNVLWLSLWRCLPENNALAVRRPLDGEEQMI